MLSFININTTNNNFNLKNLKSTLTSLKNKKLTITLADKNIGIILINSNLYNNLCIEHLINDDTYKKIDFNPQFFIYNKAKNTLADLCTQGHISDYLFSLISKNLQNKKLANFRILLKLHKINKFGIRPLINCSNTTLSVISKILDFIFKPLVSKHFSYIKDSQNLIQLTSDIPFKKGLKLFSADFESLYTNIPLDKAIDIIMQMISSNISTEISTHAIFKFLQLVLLNNYFYYRNNNKFSFFLQTKGIAMGTSCGPSVANLYLAYFEIKYKKFLDTSLYYRFIDDVIYTDSFNSLTHKFPEIFPDLKLNSVSEETVQFLDLNISFNFNRTLNFDLFIKPTFTGSYLDNKSNHPKHVFRGIIISAVSRIRRNCTDLHNYYLHTSNLLFYFKNKGFDTKLIINTIRSFANIERKTLIEYKTKKTNIFNKSIFFVTPFNSDFNIDYKYLNNSWLKCLPTNSNLSNFNIKILNQTSPNLNCYFINKIKIPFKEQAYFPCKGPLCKICPYALNYNFLFNFITEEIYLPHATTCNSKNIIYFIHCLKCKVSYIGQSSRTANIRINEHIVQIKKYKKNYEKRIKNKEKDKYIDSEILYNHFKYDNHDFKSHFRFQVICENIINYRLRLETDLIYIFNTVTPYGLNTISNNYDQLFEPYKPF